MLRIQALVSDISSWDSFTNEQVKQVIISFIHCAGGHSPQHCLPSICIHSLFKNSFQLFSACIGSVFQIQISCLFNHWLSSGGFAGPRLIFISQLQTEAFQDSRAGLFSLRFLMGCQVCRGNHVKLGSLSRQSLFSWWKRTHWNTYSFHC